jgi:radial spoke head protein 9
LNNCQENEIEELLFWGKVNGLNRDYYIAMGITYSDKWEFPDKTFYWASSNDFKFAPFPKLNEQHKD